MVLTASAVEVEVEVEVVLALPGRCWRRRVLLAAGSTAGDALERSGLAAVCRAETGAPPARVGVYGRKVNLDEVMVAGQRLELYRPLQVDPKQRRAARARRD